MPVDTCSVKGCPRPVFCKHFCGLHYQRNYIYGHPLGMSANRRELWHWVKEEALRHETTECIPQPFPIHGNAQALVCETVYGLAPTLLHAATAKCGNRRCLNPAHLSWEARQLKFPRHTARGAAGQYCSHHESILTEDDVLAIRAAPESTSNHALGKKYSIAASAIGSIRKHLTWKHVP